jgi:hypothetical protein
MRKGGESDMKKFAVREVETLKTTAALYDCGCWPNPPCEEG